MKISHIRNDDSLSYSVKAPITFMDQSDRSYPIEEWSLDSIVRGSELPRTEVQGEIFIYFQGFSIYFPVHLIPGEEEDRLYFHDLDTRQREIIRLFYNGVRTGEMVPFGDTLKSMDVPVRKVSQYPTDEDRKFEGEPRSGLARFGVPVAMLASLVFLVFGSLGYSLWQRMSFIETFNASVIKDGDGFLVVQAWVPESDTTKTWVGMTATVGTNVGGTSLALPARVSDKIASGEDGVGEDAGYLVRLVLEDTVLMPEEIGEGEPVAVRLNRSVFGGE